jgi:predicted lipoprotein with Yx(FWY)xxD motif
MRSAMFSGLVAVAAAGLAGCGAATSPATANGAVTATTITVGTATVGGTSEQVLTTSKGYTLYYFGPDTPTSSHCTGSCAGFWPPLLQPSGQPTASGSLSGSLSTLNDANGRQVEYNGHLLYRYGGDTAAGQATGNGINLNGGVWYAATPSLTPGSAGSAPASASASASGGYSGY